MNFKDIHIGSLINQSVTENRIEVSRICNFFKLTVDEITDMYKKEDLPTNILLKWSKLLDYDFFRLYSQHLILYSPEKKGINQKKKSHLPQFRKNIYTKEIIDFIIGRINSEEMTINQVIERYCIPKSTLHKWMHKYNG